MGSTRHIQATSSATSVAAARRTGRTSRFAVAAAIVALGLSACGGNFDASNDAGDESATFDAPAKTEDATAESSDGDLAIGGGSGDVSDVPAEAAAAPATAGSVATGAPLDIGRDLIVDAGVTMLTPNVGVAADDVIDIAIRNGGAVYNADVTIDDPLDDGSVPGNATIVIRIPPTQLDGLIDDLRGVGTLRNQTQSVDDVTEQLIDLDIQIRQAAISVERMEALLDEATDFDGLVAAETELVRRQTAYERLLAAQRNIDDRVALSKLTVSVQYQAPGTEPASIIDEGDPGIGDAFSDGWNAFVSVLFGIALVLAMIAPFAAIAAAVASIGWLFTRRRRRATDRAADRNRHEPLDPPIVTAAQSETPTSETEQLVDANQTD
jgi:hypothetical protein